MFASSAATQPAANTNLIVSTISIWGVEKELCSLLVGFSVWPTRWLREKTHLSERSDHVGRGSLWNWIRKVRHWVSKHMVLCRNQAISKSLRLKTEWIGIRSFLSSSFLEFVTFSKWAETQQLSTTTYCVVSTVWYYAATFLLLFFQFQFYTIMHMAIKCRCYIIELSARSMHSMLQATWTRSTFFPSIRRVSVVR